LVERSLWISSSLPDLLSGGEIVEEGMADLVNRSSMPEASTPGAGLVA